MSNPSTFSLTLAAAVANGIVTVTAHASPGAYTLNGSLVSGGVATMDVARRVLIASSGADSAIVFTVTGTDRNGNPITETVTGVASASSQYTKQDFLTVTAISSPATAGNITIGTNGVGSMAWVMDDIRARAWAMTVALTIVSGSVTYTLEDTLDDPNKYPPTLVTNPQQFSIQPAGFVPPQVWAHSSATTAATSSQITTYPDMPVVAHRATITAGTGLLVMQTVQATEGAGF